jgi:hypothetical protein
MLARILNGHELRLLGPREHDTGDVAGQSHTDACERRTEEVNLAENKKTDKHCEPDNEQKRRLKEELAVNECEISEN